MLHLFGGTGISFYIIRNVGFQKRGLPHGHIILSSSIQLTIELHSTVDDFDAPEANTGDGVRTRRPAGDYRKMVEGVRINSYDKRAFFGG
jgi:hypothetical protein